MYEGADWIQRTYKCEMSPLGRSAANLPGDVFLGIYHLDGAALKKAEWGNDHHIRVTIYGELSSVDNNLLTRLLVLAHPSMLRVSIEGCGPKYPRLMFHQRINRDGRIYERCPTIESHIEEIRSHYKGA